jgi:amino acid transporter
MIAVLVVMFLIFIGLIITSGFVADATRRLKAQDKDDSGKIKEAHKSGTTASMIGWILVAAIIILGIITALNFEFVFGAATKPGGGTIIKIAVYLLFGIISIASGICGGFSLDAAVKVKASKSYDSNKTSYKYFLGSGVSAIIILVAIIGVVIYQRYSKYSAERDASRRDEELWKKHLEYKRQEDAYNEYQAQQKNVKI